MRKSFIIYAILILLCSTIRAQAQNWEACQEYDRTAMNFYYEKQYKEALIYIEKLAVCNPTITNYYNAACIASLAGDKKKGFLFLKEAINRGYTDSLHMFGDDDLAYLKSLKEWKQIAKWLAEARKQLYEEISKIQSSCPATDLIPYMLNGKWGYLDRKTKHKITEPVFDKASFVGKTGSVAYGDREILFTCFGQVIKDEQLISMNIADYSDNYTPNSMLSKGFTVEEGKIKEIAPIYQEFFSVNVNNGQVYAIAATAPRRYALIDSTGRSVAGIENYKWLQFYNYGMDSKYFPDDDLYNDFFIFYADTLGNAGIFLHDDFENISLKSISDFGRPYGNGFDREYLYQVRNYIYLKQGSQWGIWDCNLLQWLVKPEYDRVFYTDRTYDGNYEDNYYRGSTVELYFMVKQNGQEFFIDKNNVKYIPEE